MTNSGHNWKDEELIDRYFDGVCSREELRAFGQRCEADSSFAEKVNAMRTIRKGVDRLHDEDRVRKRIGEAVREEERRKVRIRSLVGTAGGAFAAAAVFILFLAYSPLRIPVQPQEIRAVRNLEKTGLTDSLEAGKKKAFGLFFEAQSYLAEGELQPAILKLEELAEMDEMRPYFKEAVQWHLVMAHLKNGNVERAASLYEKVKTPEEYSIPLIDRWKVWWQLHRRMWIG